MFFLFFKQKTADEMRISDWSSDVCSSDLLTDKTWGISAHVLDQKRPGDYAWRQVEKAYQAAEVEGEPFQTDKDGKPYANQHNIRLALSKMGVTVRQDRKSTRLNSSH